MKFTYRHFEILMHVLVAVLFLTEFLKDALPQQVYEFLKTNKDTLFGIYYCYLAFNIYKNIEIGVPTE